MTQVDKNSKFAKYIIGVWERKQIMKQYLQDEKNPKNLAEYEKIKVKFAKPL